MDRHGSRNLSLIVVLTGAIASSSISGHIAPAAGPSTTHGAFTIHLILHAVGEEAYDLVTNPDGTRTLTTTFDYTDRSNRRTTTAR